MPYPINSSPKSKFSRTFQAISKKFQPFVKLTLPAIFTFFLIFSALFYFVDAASQTSRTQFEKRQEEIKALQGNVDKALSGATQNLETAEAYEATLEGEIAKREEEIQRIDAAITSNNQLIALNEEELKIKEQEKQRVEEEIVQLLKDIQKNQSSSTIANILTSNSLTEVLSEIGNLTNIGNQAEDLRVSLIKKTEELNKAIEDLEKSQADLEDLKATQNSQKDGLEDLKAKTQQEQAAYQALISEFASRQAELESEAKKNQEAWANSPLNPDSPNYRPPTPTPSNPNPPRPPSGTCWFEATAPLNLPSGYFARPASGRVSRVFSSCRHDGADIANSRGTPIYSIAAGTVVEDRCLSTGYGCYIVIRHNLPGGQRIYSLYAHMDVSSPLNVGSSVSRGQRIGGIGNRGWSTGPHLHFMVFSDSYESSGVGCRLGGSKCYEPTKIGVPIY